MIHTPRSVSLDFNRRQDSAARVRAILGRSKVGAGCGLDWAGKVIGNTPNPYANSQGPSGTGCAVDQPCKPLQLGIPQGAALGVVATTAAATFALVVPVAFIPMQLVLHGAAVGLQVTDMHTALDGPMIAGAATSPIGGDAFAANVPDPYPLEARRVETSQSIFVSVINPTLSSITFVGSIKGLRA